MSSPISYFTAELGFNVRDLPSGKVVFFQLRCRNEVGWSPWSPAPDALATEDDPEAEAAAGIITKATAPAEPDAPGLVQRTSRSIKFKWTRPDDHGAVVFEHILVVGHVGEHTLPGSGVEGVRDAAVRNAGVHDAAGRSFAGELTKAGGSPAMRGAALVHDAAELASSVFA